MMTIDGIPFRTRSFAVLLAMVLASAVSHANPPAGQPAEGAAPVKEVAPNERLTVPKILVLDAGDADDKDRSGKLRFLSAEGEELRVISGLKRGQTVGGSHFVAVDRERGRVYFSPSRGNLSAIDFTGKELWKLDVNAGALAVDLKSGNLWCLSSKAGVEEKIIVVALDGKLVGELPLGGVDIVYDSQKEVFWICGTEIVRADSEGRISVKRPLPELPPAPQTPNIINGRNWFAVSIAPDLMQQVGDGRRGGAWAAIRSHPDRAGSRSRLVRFDDQGEVRVLVELGEIDPFAVGCDAVGNCWVVDRRKGVIAFNADGEKVKALPMSAVAVATDRGNVGAWVSTEEEVVRLDHLGNVVWRYKLGYKAWAAWLGTDGL